MNVYWNFHPPPKVVESVDCNMIILMLMLDICRMEKFASGRYGCASATVNLTNAFAR